jgi:phenylpropionate dioxygenase-like ring-hydroxylating dioxygenase large terminal subunit
MTQTAPSAPEGSASSEGWLTDSWYFAALSDAVKPGAQIRRNILGQPVVIARTAAGEAFALRDICPHRLVPLSAGRQVMTAGQPTIECPYHGWRFGTDGVCRLMPSLTGEEPYRPDQVRVRRYPVHEAAGMIFVFVATDPRSETPPCLPAPTFDTPSGRPAFVVEQLFRARMDDAVVGLMDPAHVPFVHNQWWWRPPSTGLRLKEKVFEPRERGWAIARHAPSGNSLAYRALFGGRVTTEIVFQIPGFRWETVDNGRRRLFTLTCLTPESAQETRITQITYWSGAPLLDIMKPILIPAARKFLAQDGRMVDLQNLGLAHQKAMIWIDDIDVQAKWYMALKREWSASRREARSFRNPIETRTLKWRS